MRALRFVSYALVTGLLAAPEPSAAWPTLIPGTPDNGRPFAVTADGAGDVLVAGRVLALTGDDDGFLAKLGGSDGAVVWQHTIDGTALPGPGGEDAAAEVLRGLAIAAGNDVVAGGLAVDAVSGADLLVTRRAALDGAPVWQIAVDGGAGLGDNAQALALDPSGDVLVTGALTATGTTVAEPAVLKLAGATGVEAWRVLVSGPGGVGRAIAPDAAGDVLVAGDIDAGWFVAKRANADGAPLWRTDLPGDPGNAVVRALALRPGGAPVVAGRLFAAATGGDFVVVALAADGNELWRYVLDGSAVDAADDDDAFSVAVDAAGDVVAAGVVSNAVTDDDLVVVKLDGTAGTEKWRIVIDGGNDNDDDASSIAIDPAGNVAVVGSLRKAGSGRDLAVLLLDGQTGDERWRRVVDGATGQADVGFAAGLDGATAVLAAGRTRNGTSADGLTVLKLSHATGGDFPCGTGTLEGDEVCDDANLALGDGCRPDCTAEACGDGILDPQESCDDGNLLDGDCCSALCVADGNGSPCDDHDACTTGDLCTGGVCGNGTVTVCVPINSCHDGVCDPATGLCSDVPRPDGRLCDDGDACTVVDECLAGQCLPGAARPCDDYDPCTADSCVPATGCGYEPLTGFDGVSCAFDPTRIATFCFAGLPRAIERRIERAESRIDKAAASPKVGRAKRLLKSARNLAEQARRRAVKQTIKGQLSAACGAALQDTLAEVGTRALALREALAAEP